VERDALASGREIACGDEDPTEANVARLGGQPLPADPENHWHSQVDATLAGDNRHLSVRVAWSGNAASRGLDALAKEST